MTEAELATLPGGKLVAQGLSDLARGRDTPASLLIQIAATRLRSAGLSVPQAVVAPEAELRLYALLCEHEPDAYGRYNALLRDLVSCERALEARAARADSRGEEELGRPTGQLMQRTDRQCS